MVRIARLSLALVLSLGVGVAPIEASAGPAEGEQGARELYADGERAYRVGEFDVAAEKFQAAYDLAPDRPALLYNLGLAYKRLFETDEELPDGRKAKAVLENFLIEIQKNPALGDEAEIKTLLAEVEKKLKEVREAEQRDKDREAELERERIKAQGAKNGDRGKDPGKVNRIAGYSLIGGGSLFVVGGGTLAVIMGLRGQQFEDDLSNCASNDSDCINTARGNGQDANVYAFALGVPAIGIGAIALGIGVWQLVKGNKRTREWKAKNDLSFAPTRDGFVLSGRF